MKAYASVCKRIKAYKNMKERSHLKWHTFWWDQAIHIKQPKHMEAYINAYKNMKERSHLKYHTFCWDQAIHFKQPEALATSAA